MWSAIYCLLVFVSVLGVLQLAAAHNNLRNLLFFSRKGYTVGFAVPAIGVPLFVFFSWYNFYSFVVEGGQQTGSFILSAGAALLFTLGFSSILNRKRAGKDNPAEKGLDVLRETTYFQAVCNHRNGKEQ
jgi:hypothetical protein